LNRDLSDDTLMAAVARGEEAAFGLLVHRWEHQVRAFLSAMLGNREEAEDLTQDTFVKVFAEAGRYRPAGMFRSWLMRIAGNLARSRLRRRRIIGWLPFEPGRHDRPAGARDPQRELEDDQTARAVREALAALPERQRQALVLQRFQGMKYREIASAMDTTLAGVESLIQRGLAGLRETLERQGVEP